jgi:hypothetical protein
MTEAYVYISGAVLAALFLRWRWGRWLRGP